MKRIILGLSLLVAATASSLAAGTITEIWTDPAIFLPDEEVTIYFDVTGTDVENTSDLYWWSWSPSDPAMGNGDWGNSPAHMALTQVEGNVWSFTMTPTDFYGQDAANVTQIFGLVKTQDGSAQTDNFDEANGNGLVLYDISNLAGTISDYRPLNFTADRPISILLNANRAFSDGGGETGQLVGQQPAMHSGVNTWNNVVDAGSDPKTLATDIGNGFFKIDLIPADYYGIDPTTKLSEINYLFNNNGSWDQSARDEGGENFLASFIDPNAVTVVEKTSFPTAYTIDDVVTFTFFPAGTEVEDLQNPSEVFYTMTANGTETVEGRMNAVGDGTFDKAIIPSLSFPGIDITSLEVVFRNADGSAATEALDLAASMFEE
ncbi:MAG TPA: hypothetical protein DCE41_20705 [Cytophagales bacterium]|nr:hypothetical protein [Cytophagales bacterium]HAA22297.1 hypothetical protein [Cytophagales bacterium]HAP60491.1 hypothetical protein [Cytophagales bacterium]